MLIRTKVGQFLNRVYKSANSIWVPDQDNVMPIHNNIIGVVGNPEGKLLISTYNLVTTRGDLYYAQKAAGESPTNNFTTLYLSSLPANTTISKANTTDDLINITVATGSSSKNVSATYPRTADPDSDNTGAKANAVSWLFSYTTGDFDDPSVEGAAIAEYGVTSWGASAGQNSLLTLFNFVAFQKANNATLKVFVNHQMLGV